MPPEGTEARDTVNLAQAVHPDRLLRGEPTDASEWREALRWVSVYQELVSFNIQLMELVQKRIDSITSSDDGPERPDLLLIQAHYARLCSRLDFWKRRCIELAPSEAIQAGALSFAPLAIAEPLQ
jgi:hypothetical protein